MLRHSLVKLLGQHLTTRLHCSRIVLQRFLTISQHWTCQLTCNSTLSHTCNASLFLRIITFVHSSRNLYFNKALKLRVLSLLDCFAFCFWISLQISPRLFCVYNALFSLCRYTIAPCVPVKFYIVGHHPDNDNNSNKISCGLSWCTRRWNFIDLGRWICFRDVGPEKEKRWSL